MTEEGNAFEEQPVEIAAEADSSTVDPPYSGPRCPFCGNPVIEDAVVCLSCGRQIKDLKTVPDKSAGWSCGVLIVLGIVSGLIPCVGVVIGLVALLTEGNRDSGVALIVIALMSMFLYMCIMGVHFPPYNFPPIGPPSFPGS